MGRRGGQQDSGGRAGADAAPGALPSRRQARTKNKESRRQREASSRQAGKWHGVAQAEILPRGC
jgi:hypothetical protein